ncbi:MAG: hypothetical protein AM1032_000319 [Mycoplasmataceae bacterium]|nr:MAG: hypothetical protein AM1032_000319 [Mycoplasmataceae bacterium]
MLNSNLNRNLQTLSIAIKPSLYETIQEEIGKGKISKFIETIVEKEIVKIKKARIKKEKEFNSKMINYYKACASNLEEDSIWEDSLNDVE